MSLLYWTKFSPEELASVQVGQKLVALNSAYKAGILASSQGSSQRDTQNGGRLARIPRAEHTILASEMEPCLVR